MDLSMTHSDPLLKLWRLSKKEIDPAVLLRRVGRDSARTKSHSAALFWGKAAARSFASVGRRYQYSLVIAPEGPSPAFDASRVNWVVGEHPLPGNGSFAAGAALLDFFDALRRWDVQNLDIFLSGGASSLAWVLKDGMSRRELLSRLQQLYARSLTIAQLNQERAKLCALKKGGAGRWLRALSPKTRARVFLISDVLPFGPEFVGSGPFWISGNLIPHRVLADNSTWLESFRRNARQFDLPVLSCSSGHVEKWLEWVEILNSQIENAIRKNRGGLILMGGEPRIQLPRAAGSGGRMSHLAAALALRFLDPLCAKKMEILCVASDGVDGRSGAAGAHLGRGFAVRATRDNERIRKSLGQALGLYDSASVLRDFGALMTAHPSGTNVQDCVAIYLASPLL